MHAENHYVICFPSQAVKMGSIYKHRKLNLLLCRKKQPIQHSSTVTFTSVSNAGVSFVQVTAATWAFIACLSKFCTMGAKVLISFLNRLAVLLFFSFYCFFFSIPPYATFCFFIFSLSIFQNSVMAQL